MISKLNNIKGAVKIQNIDQYNCILCASSHVYLFTKYFARGILFVVILLFFLQNSDVFVITSKLTFQSQIPLHTKS